MKRKLLFTFLIAVCNFFAYSQFTPGNLVVVRVGNGSTAIAASAARVSLLEFNAAGTPGTTVDLNFLDANAGSRLTIMASSGAEGLLKLSNNNQFLTLAGYDVAVGTTTTLSAVGASSNTRVIARINSAGAVDYSTKILKIGSGTANTDYYSGNIKTVVSDDGEGFWIGNSANGLRYVSRGNGTTTLPTIITTTGNPSGITAFTNMRALNIFNGQLYASLTSTPDYGMVQIGTGIPTTAGQTPVNLSGFSLNNASSGDFVFFDLDAIVPGLDVAYTLEAGALKKHTFNGTTWSSSSSVGTGRVNAINTIVGSSGYTSAPTVLITGGGGSGATATANLTADVVTSVTITNGGVGYSSAPTVSFTGGGGTTTSAVATIATQSNGMTGILVGGKPVLFYTSGANAGNNALIRLNDDNGYAAAINPTVHSVIALAGANYVFRGVAFTPNTITVPVDLTSFTGKNSNIGVQLNWETALERNNERFEIFRSTTKDNFKLLTSVKGKGNSDEKNKYSFIDTEPAKGVNYYKLNQIDFDGKVTSFDKLVAVNTGLGSSEFKISNSSDDLNYTINATKSAEALLAIYDLNGRKVLTKKIFIQTGFNSDKLSITELNNGVYVANISLDGESFTKKFVK